MKYPAIVNSFFAQAWAILPEKHAEMKAFLRLKATDAEISPEQIQAAMGQRRDDAVQMFGRVAVVPVQGVISQRIGMMERASGGVSTEELGQTLDNLVGDKACKAIVLAFDSPGGSVFGVAELAARIRGLSAQKKIVAFADPLCASAAYWLAASCNEVYVTPSGQVGSIGVICANDDITEALKQAGIKTTLVTSAPFKAEGYPEMPLDDEGLGEMQSKVDAYHAQFVADVAKGRGVSEARVNKDFGQGRMMLAAQAVAAGMADKVTTLAKLLTSLGGDLSGPAASADLRRAQARARVVEIEEIDE